MKPRRLKMKYIVGCVVAVMLLAGLVGACAEPAPAPTPAPAPAPAPTPAPAPEPEVIELVAHSAVPSTSPPGTCEAEWAAKVEEMTNGRVKVITYYNSALFAQREAVRAMLAGTADVQFDYNVVEDPGLMALNLFFDLPFLGWGTPENATLVMKELVDKFPELTNEFQGLKVLYITHSAAESWLMCTKKQVLTSDDLKGLKFQAAGYSAKWVEAMGATPVIVSWPDIYTSLEKGVIDSSVGDFGATIASGAIELHKYYTHLPSCMRLGFFHQVMNPDTWNGLPPDIQKILTDLDPWIIQRRIELERESNKVGIAMAQEEHGATFKELSPEVVQEWIAAAKPIHEVWIEEIEAKGKPARALYDELMQLLQKYK